MSQSTRFDLIIVGGGVGGCAAALAATNLGCRVLMTEETGWIGGQLTSQAVPPDEHSLIELYGRTDSYARFREAVRSYYRDHYPLTSEAAHDPLLNPGGGWVSALCHEPRGALAALNAMLAPAISAGLLEIRTQTIVVASAVQDDRIVSIEIQDLFSGRLEEHAGAYFLDATELGDLLPLAEAEYVTGAESTSQFGELHALEEAQPDNVQALTWCYAMGYDPKGEHVIDRPAMYDYWRDYVPDVGPTSWPGALISMTALNPVTMQPRRFDLMPGGVEPSLFTYRRIVNREIFRQGAGIEQDVSLVNWPQNDYLQTNIIDKPRDVIQNAYYEAKQLSLSLLYWLQTEAPRPDGSVGYPGLNLRPEITGTVDGLAMAPYIRESRRIRALFTVTEEHIGAEMLRNAGRSEAVEFLDSIGTGYYRVDLHPSTGGDNYIDIESRAFQIPLGSLLPIRIRNLLPACKNLGVTHITNGCYRLHPVEWNIGESSGYLAGWCVKNGYHPHQVYEDDQMLTSFQHLIVKKGIQIAWPTDQRPS